MKPYNVMADLELPYPKKSPYVKRSFSLPVANGVPLRIDFEICLKRCILNLLTIPKLRAAYLFTFNETGTHWSVYDSNDAPLTTPEVRGTLLFSMREMKRDPKTMFLKIKAKSKPYLSNVKPIVSDMESLKKDEKFFVLFVFKDVVFLAGTYYDESSLCHALVSFEPRKAASQKVDLFRRPSLDDLKQSKNCYKEIGRKINNIGVRKE